MSMLTLGVQVCDFLNTAILHHSESTTGEPEDTRRNASNGPADARLRSAQQRRKVLVFAHHKSVMNALSRFLEGKMDGFRGSAVRYVRIDGETPEELRATLRRDFRDDSDIQVCAPPHA
jgi:hypothetical protein